MEIDNRGVCFDQPGCSGRSGGAAPVRPDNGSRSTYFTNHPAVETSGSKRVNSRACVCVWGGGVTGHPSHRKVDPQHAHGLANPAQHPIACACAVIERDTRFSGTKEPMIPLPA